MDSPVLLAQPVMHRVLTILFPSVLGVLLIYAGVTEYSRTEAAKGEVTATSGFAAVIADQPGVLSRLDVRLGDQVRRGQTIGTVTLPQVVTRGGDTTQADIVRMRSSVANIDRQIADYGRSMADIREQMRSIESHTARSIDSAARRGRLTAEREQVIARRLDGIDALAKRGFVANTTVDEVRLALLQTKQEGADTELATNELHRSSEDRLAALSNRLSDLRQASLGLETERLRTEKLLDDLAVRQSVDLVAPSDGIVSAVSVHPGQRIDTGMRILAVAQRDVRLAVTLQVPSKAIGLIEAGQKVALKYDAFPFQSFGVRYGRVVHVEAASIDSGRAAEEAGGLQRNFLVEVRPADRGIVAYGRQRPLRVGMTLTADIEVERRTLLAWAMSPLLGLRGQIA